LLGSVLEWASFLPEWNLQQCRNYFQVYSRRNNSCSAEDVTEALFMPIPDRCPALFLPELAFTFMQEKFQVYPRRNFSK